MLEKLNTEGEVMSLTGDAGVVAKVFVIAAFSEDHFQPDNTAGIAYSNDKDDIVMPRLMVMPATSAANCGVSSNECHCSYRLGPPPTLYNLVQEMGQVDRDQLLPVGFNRYKIYLSFPLVVSLYVRIMQQTSTSIRDRQLDALFEVSTFSMTPSECFHCTMERNFEQDMVGTDKQSCKKYCSFCTGGHKQISGVFGKTELRGFLIDFCNGKSQTTDLSSTEE